MPTPHRHRRAQFRRCRAPAVAGAVVLICREAGEDPSCAACWRGFGASSQLWQRLELCAQSARCGWQGPRVDRPAGLVSALSGSGGGSGWGRRSCGLLTWCRRSPASAAAGAVLLVASLRLARRRELIGLLAWVRRCRAPVAPGAVVSACGEAGGTRVARPAVQLRYRPALAAAGAVSLVWLRRQERRVDRARWLGFGAVGYRQWLELRFRSVVGPAEVDSVRDGGPVSPSLLSWRWVSCSATCRSVSSGPAPVAVPQGHATVWR